MYGRGFAAAGFDSRKRSSGYLARKIKPEQVMNVSKSVDLSGGESLPGSAFGSLSYKCGHTRKLDQCAVRFNPSCPSSD
jgi:hypothetical protein